MFERRPGYGAKPKAGAALPDFGPECVGNAYPATS
jgi:hypothetical protein